MSADEFAPLWQRQTKVLFDDSQLMYRPIESYSEEERAKIPLLREHLKSVVQIRLGVFFQNEFIGWSWGFQETPETFYMCNSGILEPHRRKGLYTILMKRVVDAATKEGFQRIYSRHTATNNPIIIAKLKAGFFITNFELSDTFGVLLHLCYYPNATRRKVLDFRAGQAKPDDEIRKLFKL
jgi:GNAT superfamily N-acetyltransferase